MYKYFLNIPITKGKKKGQKLTEEGSHNHLNCSSTQFLFLAKYLSFIPLSLAPGGALMWNVIVHIPDWTLPGLDGGRVIYTEIKDDGHKQQDKN